MKIILRLSQNEFEYCIKDAMEDGVHSMSDLDLWIKEHYLEDYYSEYPIEVEIK